MGKISPLAALGALLVVGFTIEIVEGQNRTAAWALVILILLGMITFNAQAFSQQTQGIFAILNAKSRPASQRGAQPAFKQ